MTIDQLETLEIIVEKGSFKAAAEHLNKTQPSLSVAIKKLEDEFSLKIFSRDEYRPKLTSEGKVFFSWAQRSLESLRELKAVGSELGIKKVEPFLCIALDPLVRFSAIHDLMTKITEANYSTEITLRTEVMDSGIQLLVAGQIDFAIAAKSKEISNVESIAYDRIELIPVVSKKLVPKSGIINLDVINKVPQIVVQSIGATHVNSKVNNNTEARSVVVTDHYLKSSMILNGCGWGRLPRHEVQSNLKDRSLVEIKDPKLKPFILDLHIMKLRNRPLGPLSKFIWSELQNRSSLK